MGGQTHDVATYHVNDYGIVAVDDAEQTYIITLWEAMSGWVWWEKWVFSLLLLL